MRIKEIMKKIELESLEKEVLLAFVLQKDRVFLLANPEFEIDQKSVDRYLKLCEERKNGKSLAYLLKNKEFYGLDFYVDERCLVPRPETEGLVEEAIKQIPNFKHQIPNKLQIINYKFKTNSKFEILNLKLNRNSKLKIRNFRILDVGTGSGCIAIALAKNIPEAEITAADISEEALQAAKINVKRYGLQKRIFLQKSDLLEGIKEKEFDIIVANLPYIGEKKYNFVAKEVLANEPRVALFGGDDGLDLYRRLFKQIKLLKYQPKLIIGEFGFEQGEEMRKILEESFKEKWEIKKDLAGIERIFKIGTRL